MRGRIHGVLAAVSLALALALTGCGGDDGTKGDSAGESDHDKALKFAACMREHGVDMEDPEPGEPVRLQVKGVDKETVDKAQEACKKYAPQNGKGPGDDPKMKEKMLKFAECMRDNGVEEFPDPSDEGGIMINKDLEDDPDFEKAQEKCQKKYMPERGN